MTQGSNKVILINGPGGSGKTTCARLLFESLGSCALLDFDSLTKVEPFVWGKKLSILGLKNAAAVVSNFFDNGFPQVVFAGGAFQQELCEAFFSFLPKETTFYYFWIDAHKSVRHDRCISRARDGADLPQFLDFRDGLMPYTGILSIPDDHYFEVDTTNLDRQEVVQTVINKIGATNLILRTDNQTVAEIPSLSPAAPNSNIVRCDTKPEIREYTESDRAALVSLTEELQDYLKAIDPLHRLIRTAEYGEWYKGECLKTLRQNHGRLFVATIHEKIVGYIAGIIDQESADMGLGYVATKAGRITELVVTKEARAFGVGSKLMDELESFFKQERCDLIRVEVFAPNELALSFYEGRGYGHRTHEIIKVL